MYVSVSLLFNTSLIPLNLHQSCRNDILDVFMKFLFKVFFLMYVNVDILMYICFDFFMFVAYSNVDIE